MVVRPGNEANCIGLKLFASFLIMKLVYCERTKIVTLYVLYVPRHQLFEGEKDFKGIWCIYVDGWIFVSMN